MKKIILCALIAINFSASSFSQDLALTTTVRDNSSYSIPAKNVNERVARSFVKNFKEAQSVNWKEKKDEYVAEFTLDGRLVMAWFTRSGNLYCTNYYGTAKHLPAEEMELVKYNYEGYEVTATTELNLHGKTVWIVSLKNSNCVRKIKISDGVIEEQEILYRTK